MRRDALFEPDAAGWDQPNMVAIANSRVLVALAQLLCHQAREERGRSQRLKAEAAILLQRPVAWGTGI